MNAAKIVRILGLLAAIVFAFVTFSYAGLVMVLLGLAIGYFVDTGDRILYLVMTVALATGVADALSSVPPQAVGDALTKILGNVSTIISAGAVTVIGMRIYERVME